MLKRLSCMAEEEQKQFVTLIKKEIIGLADGFDIMENDIYLNNNLLESLNDRMDERLSKLDYNQKFDRQSVHSRSNNTTFSMNSK